VSSPNTGNQPEQPQLVRRFSLLPATALNMTNMLGAGPFITIPLLMSAMGGPQAMLGWIVALVIVICDGMVWSELGAAMPGSGGSFHYLREAFGRERFGRLMGFLFVWQFVLSGPLEIASGYIGFASYASYIWQGLTRPGVIALVTVVGLINIALLYRRIQSIATITVSLWIGTLITVLAVIVTGALNFNPRIAFDFPPGAFNFSLGFFLGLGAATRVGVYDYLGYYDICYIGDEVRNPGRVIPRSILISTAAVALIYIGINLSIIGTVPWREFVPAADHPESNFIVSVFMQKIYGRGDDLHPAGALDGVRVGFRSAPWLLANSICRSAERLFLPRLRPPAPNKGFSVRLADRFRNHLHRGGLLLPGHRDRCAHSHTHPGAVHGTGDRPDTASTARSRHAAPISDVALSTPGAGGARRVALRLRYHAVPGDPVWRRRAGAGVPDFPALVPKDQPLAFRDDRAGSSVITS
jgi:hypothetical protein